MERAAQAIPTARFVRINLNEPDLHVDLGPRAVTVRAGALETLSLVAETALPG
jgi:hypothetical protein